MSKAQKRILILGISHFLALIPLMLIIWEFFFGSLTINPIQETTLRTGKAALIMMMVTLAVTPINNVIKIREANSIRRTFGLYTFFYATLHGLIFFWIDYGFNFEFIKLEVLDKRFIIIGVVSFLLLTPLAITSTNKWQKRLGKKWRSLHKIIYLIGVLVIVHYLWQVKADIRQPLIFGVVLLVLFVARVKFVRNWLRSLV